MARSFVRFKGKGFWSRDGNLEDWLMCLVDTIDALGTTEPWLHDAREHWKIQATVGMNGCIDSNLDGFMGADEGRRETMLGIAEAARQRLERGNFDLMNNPPGLAKVDERVVEWVLGVADAWVKLLNGELATDASTPPVIPRRDGHIGSSS